MMSYLDAEQLVDGPYFPPVCQIGSRIRCLRRDRIVDVDGFLGPLKWPASRDTHTGKRNVLSLIVTDELLRAASNEKHEAFTYWFGCSKQVWYLICVKFKFCTSRNFAPTQVNRPLLFGPYLKPEFAIGDSAVCKDRGRVRITAFSGPIGWPRCIPNIFPKSTGRPTLFVNDELVRAISSESNLGFAYWFGVHVKTCTRLRRQFGVLDTPASKELHREARRNQAPRQKYRWTPEMIAILGTGRDIDVAWQIGVMEGSVQRKRKELGIPAFINPFSPATIRKNPNRPPDFSERSLGWAHFRDNWIIGKTCAACGGSRHLDVHHIKPFSMFPELEFAEANLIVLCDDQHKNCHHRIGHCFEWKSYNPNVVEDAAASLRSIQGKIRPNATVRLLETA